nr:hypothetical protein [Tanacetum cinerariifolium]
MQKVWVLVDLPHGKRAIVRNKARLVAQGHTQEEQINYEEVFALVARIKALRLFLAYASFMEFMVYQMDVKIAFLYGTIEEEVYVCQPPGFEDPEHPDKVYKLAKELYGLHQAPRAWYETLANYLLENDLCKAFEKLMKDKFQMSLMRELIFFLGLQVKQKKDGIFISQDKYVAEILRKFGLTDRKSASTPIDTEKPLLKDPDAGSKDRPPMLAPGNYVQWKSRIKRYIYTKPNHELIYHCLKNPPYKFTWADMEVPISEVDACSNACKMWKAIERLKQGESINVQDLETNLYWKFRKFTSQDGESLESYYSRANQNNSPWINRSVGYENHRIGNVAGARESVDATDSGLIFDDEPLQKVSNDDHYNVFAMESEHPEQSKSAHDTYPIEQDAHNVIIDSLDISYDREEIDQNDDDNDLANECELLASLIKKLKCEIDENKNRNKFLETSNKKEAQIKLYKIRKDKELDKVIALENKVKVLDNIVYKTGQSVQTMNMLNNKCRTSFTKPEFLKKAQRANPRLYDIGCYNYNCALMLAPKSDEVIRLEKENRSKLSDLIRPFDYDKLNNLYDLSVSQREKSSEQRYFSERSRLSHTPVNNRYSKESFSKQTTLLKKRMDESIPWDQKC